VEKGYRAGRKRGFSYNNFDRGGDSKKWSGKIS